MGLSYKQLIILILILLFITVCNNLYYILQPKSIYLSTMIIFICIDLAFILILYMLFNEQKGEKQNEFPKK